MNLSGSDVQILQMYSYGVRPGFEPAGEVVCGHEVAQVRPELIVAFVVEALDGGHL